MISVGIWELNRFRKLKGGLESRDIRRESVEGIEREKMVDSSCGLEIKIKYCMDLPSILTYIKKHSGDFQSPFDKNHLVYVTLIEAYSSIYSKIKPIKI